MKKSKLELKVNMIVELVSDWCKRKKIEFAQSGKYSFYFKLSEIEYENIKDELKTYLQDQLGLTKKKIKNMISVIYNKNRTYFLFRAKVECD